MKKFILALAAVFCLATVPQAQAQYYYQRYYKLSHPSEISASYGVSLLGSVVGGLANKTNFIGWLIDDDDYSEYNRNSFDDALFLTSRYVAARYSSEADKRAVADVAFTLLTAYVSHNQVETLIVAAYDARDKDTLSYISSKLDALDTSGFTDSQKAVLNSDKTIIAKALNDF